MRTLLLASTAAAMIAGGLGFGGTAMAQQQQQPAGSFSRSCRAIQTNNNTLSAECADTAGRYHASSIAYPQCRGDIGNNNGILTCNGATATGGGLVADNSNNGRDPRNNAPRDPNAPPPFSNRPVGPNRQGGYDNRNDGRYTGGQPPVVLYAPGFSYPTYGDQRYGEPRFDPRFAQGGYGYGQPANRFIPIAQRSAWLEQRIARGQQEGTVDRREARDLRQQLTNLKALEIRYRRQRMLPWMMADLDKRFDQLAARINYERNDGDYRRR